MEQAFNDVGFNLDGAGRLRALQLGYDRCGEHERNWDRLITGLGMNPNRNAIGIHERQMVADPELRVFHAFVKQPEDRRRKPYPAALLVVGEEPWDGEEKALKRFESHVSFREPIKATKGVEGFTLNQPSVFDNLMSRWGERGFCLAARGEENIARLKEAFELICAKDMAWAPRGMPDLERIGGLTLVFPSRLSDEDKLHVLRRDENNAATRKAAADSGIEQVLKDAGLRWSALSPSFLGKDGVDGLHFFLNPHNQAQHDHGWFSVDELQAWTKKTGPVMLDAELRDLTRSGGPIEKLSFDLLRAMSDGGVHQFRHARWQWMDAEKTTLGLAVSVSKASPNPAIASGVHGLNVLCKQFLGVDIDPNKLLSDQRAHLVARRAKDAAEETSRSRSPSRWRP